MPINIKNAFTPDRQIAQGEDYVIFFRILPSPTDHGIDYVYAQTDEGSESTIVEEPEFGVTLQLRFSGEQTSQFSVGDHYVRIWAVETEMKYVLFETNITVNPAFPLTEDIRYTYKNKFTTDVGTIQVPEVEITEGRAVRVKTYPIFRGKIDSPFQFKGTTTLWIISEGDEFPTQATIGDLVLISSDDDTGYLYICIQESPTKWKRISEKIFEGSYEGLVPVSDEETQEMYLKGDGTWSYVGKESLQTEDFILNYDTVDINCDF